MEDSTEHMHVHIHIRGTRTHKIGSPAETVLMDRSLLCGGEIESLDSLGI